MISKSTTRAEPLGPKTVIPGLGLLRSMPACLALLVVAGLAGSAFAQSIDIPAALNPDLKAPPTIITVQGGYQSSVDVGTSGTSGDDGTDMGRRTFFVGANHRIKLNDETSLFLVGTYTLYQYDFDNKSQPNRYYQWDDINRLVVAALVGYDLNEHWRLIGGAMYRSWGQTGADYDKSITGGGLGGFDYHPNEDFSVGLLFGLFSELEGSPALIPVPTLKWRFAEQWRLNIGMVSMVDPGVGAEVTWQIAKSFSMGLGATYQNRRYRLNDGNLRFAANGRSTGNGIGQESNIPVFGLVQLKPTPNIAIDLMSGISLAGELRVESSTGASIASDSYDPAPFVALKGQIAF